MATSGERRRGLTRREALLSALAVAATAGAGSVLGVRRPWSALAGRANPPTALVAALAAESDAIARVDATASAHPELRSLLAAIRADHTSHASALTAALRRFPSGTWSTGPGQTGQTTGDASRSALATAETAAATDAARRATQLAGSDAVLLASIAACESSHAAVLA